MPEVESMSLLQEGSPITVKAGNVELKSPCVQGNNHMLKTFAPRLLSGQLDYNDNDKDGFLLPAALSHHDLSGKRKTDAAARVLGGEERDEDFATHFSRNRFTIITDVEGIIPSHIHVLCSSFLCILHQVDNHLPKQIVVSVKNKVVRNGNVPVQLSI